MTDGHIDGRISPRNQKSVFRAYYAAGDKEEPEPSSSFAAGQHPSCSVRDRSHRRPSIGTSSPSDVVQRRLFRRRKSFDGIRQGDHHEEGNGASSESFSELFSLLQLGTFDKECFTHRQLESPEELQPTTQLKSDFLGEYEIGLKGPHLSSSRRTARDVDLHRAHHYQRSRSLEEESSNRTAASFRNGHHDATSIAFRTVCQPRSGSTGDLGTTTTSRRSRGYSRRSRLDPSRRPLLLHHQKWSEVKQHVDSAPVLLDRRNATFAELPVAAEQQQQQQDVCPTSPQEQGGEEAPEIPTTCRASCTTRLVYRRATTSMLGDAASYSPRSSCAIRPKSTRRLSERLGPGKSPRTIIHMQSTTSPTTIDDLLTSNSQHRSRRKEKIKAKFDSFSGRNLGESPLLSDGSGSGSSTATTTEIRRPSSLVSMD